MKRFLTIAAIFFITAVTVSAKPAKRDSDGHVLVKEWTEYCEAAAEDLPRTRENILGKILDKAESERLDWDFYDAACKYYDAIRSYDWKKASGTYDALQKRITDYGSPVMLWNAGHNFPYFIDINEYGIRELTSGAAGERLRQERNDPFYLQDRFLKSGSLPSVIVANLRNDYEYLLWSALMRSLSASRYRNAGLDSLNGFTYAVSALKEYYDGLYPQAACIEFIEAVRIPKDSADCRKAALERFAGKYPDKGIRFFAESALMEMEFEALSSSAAATSDDFRALREKCVAFEKNRKAEKAEADLLSQCTYPEGLIRKMDFRQISARIQDNTDTLLTALKNLDKVRIRLMDADSTVIEEKVLENGTRSYFIPDTLKYVISGIDDGDYIIECSSGDVRTAFRYRRHTLSAALQRQDRGIALYLADFVTGEPVRKADIDIYYKDSLIRTIPGQTFDGFTLIDTGISEPDGLYYLQCRLTGPDGRLRMSGKTMFRPASSGIQDTAAGQGCIILKDRAAFNPGDTLKFKVILYETIADGNQARAKTDYRIWADAGEVTAELKDAAGKTVGKKTLKVNDFGSAAASFHLPEDSRNGRFTLSISRHGKVLETTSLRVDEFELPTFGVTFEPSNEIYFPGDTVTVRGKIESYSGRSLAAAHISYSVTMWNETCSEGSLEPAPDGSFELPFTTKDKADGSSYHYYTVEIKVTDATGESHRFSKGIPVYDFYFNAVLENAATGSVQPYAADAEADSADFYGLGILEGDFAILTFDLRNAGSDPVYDRKVSYSVDYDGQSIISGEALSCEKTWIDLSSWPSGVFRLKASAKADGREKTCVLDLVKTAENDTALCHPFRHFIKVLPSEDIRLQFGAADGPVWAAVQLFGGENTCLESGMVHIEGICGKEGSLKTLSYAFEEGYPDAVEMKITWFRDGDIFTFSHDFTRPQSGLDLPLSFSRFTDKAWPGERCVYEIQTLPGVECAVSVFDMTTETIQANWWDRLEPRFRLPSVYETRATGRIYGLGLSPAFRWDGTVGFGTAEMIPFQTAVSSPRLAADAVLEKSSVQNSVMSKASGASPALEVSIRENFADALAFYPFLRSDENGKISFEVTAGDKLSTFYVSLFAHDKAMHNNALRQKMLVTLPVAVSVTEPSFLFSGDRYDMQVSLSNTSETASEGTLSLYLYDGGDYDTAAPLMVMSRPAGIASGAASAEIFSIDVPEGIDTLGIKVTYLASEGFSDGIFVTVPVSAPEQILYESHSALLKGGMSRDSLYSALRQEFVNVSGYGAVSQEISIADMLGEAIPDTVPNPSSPDAVSTAGAWFSARLSHFLKGGPKDDMEDGTGICKDCERLAAELLAYQNTTGGFAWLKGGPSSPAVTATVLEYIACLSQKGLAGEDDAVLRAAEKAVRYLDSRYFSDDSYETWRGGITLGQYLYVRSLYAGIPLSKDLGRKEKKAFAKEVKVYAFGKEAGAPGYILYKARRAMTVLNFIGAADKDRENFLGSIGVKVDKKLSSALGKQMASLKEYAAAHRSGGKYYPNAVLPFRGLLENELYAHTVLCRLLSGYGEIFSDSEASEIADDIRLWIMIQKETQDWGEDPAFLLAIDEVSEGSEDLLEAKVLILTQKYRKPFSGIRAAGNDISVRCRYFVEDTTSAAGQAGDYAVPEGFREISEGEVLKVGDRVMAVYEIWSAENRSFVRLTAPRYASLRPEKQLSGPYGISFRPRTSGTALRYFTPYSYREVKSDRSIWYIDVLPEENTVLTETLIVTQAGEFSSPVTGIECLYAPHYRANDSCHRKLSSTASASFEETFGPAGHQHLP